MPTPEQKTTELSVS